MFNIDFIYFVVCGEMWHTTGEVNMIMFSVIFFVQVIIKQIVCLVKH